MQLKRPQTVLSICAVIAFLFGGGGSALLWAGDQRYAQKADIDALADVVQTNSVAQLATVSSVDVLLIQVLDMRIEELETEIRELENEDELTTREEALLADLRRDLADLQVERNLTLDRVLARRSQ